MKSESADFVELSVVIPCLNEQDTLKHCITVALGAFLSNGIQGEVIVADNGSSDRSPEIALEMGARLVRVAQRGYGFALQEGIKAAQGEYIVMGDADASYDFGEIAPFLIELRAGADLVQGCRLPSGGGKIVPGSMPFLHRWIGNPMLTLLARVLFRTPVDDIYCGLRGFRKTAYQHWEIQCGGMEFATEMILKASLEKSNIRQVPITLHKDGRLGRGSHLRTFRDGWRTLRLFLVLSPQWLFLYPGLLLCCAGILGFICAFVGLKIGDAELGVHTMLVSGIATLIGVQACLFFICSRLFGIANQFLKHDPAASVWKRFWSLERMLIISAFSCLLGLATIGFQFWSWASGGFAPLNYEASMRVIIPGTLFLALGFQGIFAGFMAALLMFRIK